MGCTCSSESVAVNKPRGLPFPAPVSFKSPLRQGLANDLCSRCREIVLPEPGTQWSHDFGESDVTVTSFGTSCPLCKLVRMQLWLSLERGELNRGIGVGVAIDLNTRQEVFDKLYCRMRSGINGTVITVASLSVRYLPSGQ